MGQCVDWRHGQGHMWDNHRVTTAEADEAIADPDCVWMEPDPKSRSGDSIRVIGYSRTHGAVLTVILVRDPKVAWLWGANGWPSNATDRRAYGDDKEDDDGRD